MQVNKQKKLKVESWKVLAPCALRRNLINLISHALSLFSMRSAMDYHLVRTDLQQWTHYVRWGCRRSSSPHSLTKFVGAPNLLAFRAQSLNLINVAVHITMTNQSLIRVVVVKIQRSRFGCSFNRGPHELRERVGRGETAATSTSRASSLLQARFDEGAVVISFGEHWANEVSNEINKISARKG